MPKKKKGELTPKQQAFTEEYLKDLNGSKAAKRAGFSARSAKDIAFELVAKPEIKKVIQKKMDERSERTKIDADYVLTTIKDTVERCRQAEQVMAWDPLEKTMVPTGEWKFDANAVLKGCDLLGKHIKLWSDAPKVDFNINLSTMSDEELDKKIQEYESRLK